MVTDPMTIKTKPCSTGCGRTASVEIPDDLGDNWREILNRIPVLCDECGAKVEAKEKREADEEDRRKWLDRVANSHIPDLWVGGSFADIDRKENHGRARAVAAAEEWGAGKIRGLVLSGPVGIGKSRLAGTAASERLKREPLDWLQVPGLVTRARAGYDTEARKEVTRVLMRSRRALVLDDIDKVKPTEFVQDLLFQIIDERTSNGAPLLVTTNLSGDDLEALLGEPVRSRLRGYCKAFWVNGRDRRTQPGDNPPLSAVPDDDA